MADAAPSERSPFLVTPGPGANGRIGTLLGQLTSSRHYLLNAVRDLGATQLDAIAPGCPNTIGSLLAHVAAAERMFQNITCRGYRFGDGEEELEQAFRFERNPLAGNDLGPYRRHLLEMHRETASLLEGREDAWLDTATTFRGQPSNYHYYWTHLLMDEARHTGQLILIRKHLLPDSDPQFDPYRVA